MIGRFFCPFCSFRSSADDEVSLIQFMPAGERPCTHVTNVTNVTSEQSLFFQATSWGGIAGSKGTSDTMQISTTGD
jgi:hypothetical protein